MSEAGGKKVSLWDGIIQYDEPVPATRTEEVKADIEAGLAKLGEEKEKLLKMLSDECAPGPGGPPSFDADKAWGSLIRVAETHLWWSKVKQMAMSDATERLRELAKALGATRNLVDVAMQDEVGDDLFDAWWAETNETLAAVVYDAEEMFGQVIANLRTLEIAAVRAAEEAARQPGRPRGTGVVPRGSIPALADVFHKNTGETPGAGDGPFARFAYAFFAALGPLYFTYGSLVDAIKKILPRWRSSLLEG
jgi:hypothetical protein